MLVALGIYDDKWPPYAADLRFELFEHKTTGEHFVRTLYCDQVRKIEVRVPGRRVLNINFQFSKLIVTFSVRISSHSHVFMCEAQGGLEFHKLRTMLWELEEVVVLCDSNVKNVVRSL